MNKYKTILDGLSINTIFSDASYSYMVYASEVSSSPAKYAWVVMRENTTSTEYKYATGVNDIPTNLAGVQAKNYKFIYEIKRDKI